MAHDCSPAHYEARNRTLLYTQGITLPPTESVALALESLQRTQKEEALQAENTPQDTQTHMQKSMASLQELLQEKNIPFQVCGPNGQPLQSAPPITRASMISESLERNIFTFIAQSVKKLWQKNTILAQEIQEKIEKKPSTNKNTSPRTRTASTQEHVTQSPTNTISLWEKTVAKRRFILMVLTVFPSLIAGAALYSLFADTAWQPLLLISCALFTILFYWISVGFWNFMAGIASVMKKVDNFSFTHTVPKDTPLPTDTRTALLFPIYNEDAHTVCAGIKTVWQSLCQQGIEKHFDIFILSDSTKADAWVNEEHTWHELCESEKAHEHIFYRHRKMNLKRKSGNIADFCRRWGTQYRYMIIFDADSLMSAQSLQRLVQIMETNPSIGIVQALPKVIKSQSLLARVQQFANHLYGPVFAAGLNFWRLGNTQYWGHNAIIRVAPFMQHCQLPKLPGKAPLGGEILSHDFVESALMRRAGYGVWLAYDVDGSYEQCPPSLIDELIRDRRWCQGNLQHSRLLFTKGFFPTHRALFANGIMSYVSALLWLLFLLTSSAQVIMELFIVPDYFSSELSLLPSWPQYFPHWLLTLVSCTAALLFLPKIFVIMLMQVKGGAKAFGGSLRLTLSVLCEVIISTFIAPVRMLFHSSFVITSLLGRIVSWNSQNRADTGTSWGAALRFHWWGTVLGSLWGWFMYVTNPEFFLWFSPVAFGLIFSIPLSVWTSKVSLGQYARRWGLFLTPPETEPCTELTTLEKNLDHTAYYNPFAIPLRVNKDAGFIRTVVIHAALSLHISLHRSHKKLAPHVLTTLEKAIESGPDALSNADKVLLLHNPQALLTLHRNIWASDTSSALRWGIYTK